PPIPQEPEPSGGRLPDQPISRELKRATSSRKAGASHSANCRAPSAERCTPSGRTAGSRRPPGSEANHPATSTVATWLRRDLDRARSVIIREACPAHVSWLDMSSAVDEVSAG